MIRQLKANPFILALPLLLPFSPILSAVGLVALLLSQSFRGLLLGWGALFATLFFFRDLPHPERIFAMGCALSMGLSSFIAYFLTDAQTDNVQEELRELEADLSAIRSPIDDDMSENQLISDLTTAEQANESAMQEISSLEGVVEQLLGELKSRSVPNFSSFSRK